MLDRRRLTPFVLPVAIAVADQVTKLLVLRFIQPYRQTGQIVPVIGDFVNFIRTQNLGVAFSIGYHWPDIARRILFIIVPLIVMIFAGLYIVRSRDLSRFQRWVIAGIIGGGLGNMIDRIIRPEGVVDFILVNMYGFLGQQYFPVFNLADSCITVCGILLVGSLLFNRKESSPAVGEDAG